jgi:hypothetical protein
VSKFIREWGPWLLLAIFFFVVASSWPFPMSHQWVWMLLAWGMVLWVPLAVKHTRSAHPTLALWMSAAGLLPFLTGAWSTPWNWLSTLPYLCILSYKVLETWRLACWKLTSNGISDLYLWVGGFHLLAWTAGGLGLPFSPDIILLTALHFHFAGFLIPWVLQRWMLQLPGLWVQLWLHLGLMSGTALGIFWTRCSGQPQLEAIAGVLTSINIMVAVSRYTFISPLHPRGMLLWCVLMCSMCLAGAYALRPWWPLDFLSIPFMRATHGTLNALLFPILVLYPYPKLDATLPKP